MNTATNQTNGKAKAEPPALSAVRDLALSLLDESKTQPRKTFVGVEDLGKDIAIHGVLQPILVRPKGKRFEIVFGARRFRAAKIAHLGTIPAMVRDLDDAKALELQIVENSQREDVHPLEEADGYQALHTTHGYSVEEIAAKVGKSTASVYARLKLCALIPDAREAFFAEKLNAATALLVARIPHADLQKKALGELTAKGWNGAFPSAREAADIVKRRFMLRLVDAPFDRSDVDLVPAGACGSCPKRTGSQKELFADLESKDDLCTDPKCFDAKVDADAKKKLDAAKERGQAVLADKEAKKLFAHGSLRQDSGFVDLSAQVWQGAKQTTPRDVLGKSKTELSVVLARDPDGKVRELVDAKEYAAATKAPKPKPSKADLRAQEEAEAEKKKREREAKKRALAITAIISAAERRQPNDRFWRVVAECLIFEFGHYTDDVAKRRGLTTPEDAEDPDTTLKAAIAKMPGATARGLVVELLALSGTKDSALEAFQKLYGTNVKKGR